MVADQVAVVTGANGGIGLELVRSLLRTGWRVAALDLVGDRLDAEGVPPDRLLFRPCDLRDDADVQRSVALVLDRWGRIDLLVNNAAVASFGRFDAGGPEVLRQALDLNVVGYARMTAAVLPAMRRQRGGTIANMSSVLAFTGLPELAAYAASKAAVEALSRSLTLELRGTGIRVKLLHAPLTRTPASTPLQVPDAVKADPAKVAAALVAGIRKRSRRPVVVADGRTRMWLLVARLVPATTGRFQARFVAGSRLRGWGRRPPGRGPGTRQRRRRRPGRAGP